MVRAARQGIGRTSHEWTSMTAAVPGTAASSPTSAMRTTTGQRSIGSMRPNQAASSSDLQPGQQADDGEIKQPGAEAHGAVGAERPGHAHHDAKQTAPAAGASGSERR